MSDEERAEVEQANGLGALDTDLRLIDRRLRCWLRTLPTNPAEEATVVVASLEVTRRLLPVEENRVVHGLIARAVRRLSRMRNRS